MPTVHSVMANSISAATRNKYVKAIEELARYCDDQGVRVLPLDMDVLIGFFDPWVTAKAFRKVNLFIAAIKWYADITNSEISSQMKRFFQGLKRESAADNNYVKQPIDLRPSDIKESLRKLLTLPNNINRARAIITVILAYYANLR